MPNSPAQWAPWISDPDPPEKPMSQEELKSFALKVKEWWLESQSPKADMPKPSPVKSKRQ